MPLFGRGHEWGSAYEQWNDKWVNIEAKANEKAWDHNFTTDDKELQRKGKTYLAQRMEIVRYLYITL